MQENILQSIHKCSSTKKERLNLKGKSEGSSQIPKFGTMKTNVLLTDTQSRFASVILPIYPLNNWLVEPSTGKIYSCCSQAVKGQLEVAVNNNIPSDWKVWRIYWFPLPGDPLFLLVLVPDESLHGGVVAGRSAVVGVQASLVNSPGPGVAHHLHTLQYHDVSIVVQ